MIRPEFHLRLEDTFAHRTDLAGRVAYARLRPLAGLFPNSRRFPTPWDITTEGTDITLTGKQNVMGFSSILRLDMSDGSVHRLDVRTGPAKWILPPRLLIAWWQDAKGPAITADMEVREERRIHSTSEGATDNRLSLLLETSRAFVTPESNAHTLMLRGASEALVMEQLGITYPVRVRPRRIRFDGSQRHETLAMIPHEPVERIHGESGHVLDASIRRNSMRWFAEAFGLTRTSGKNLLRAWYTQFRDSTWRMVVQPPVVA